MGKAGIWLGEALLGATAMDLQPLLSGKKHRLYKTPKYFHQSSWSPLSHCYVCILSSLPELPGSFPGTLRTLELSVVTCCWSSSGRHLLFTSSALALRKGGKSLETFPAWPWFGKSTPWEGRSKGGDGGEPPTIWVCRNRITSCPSRGVSAQTNGSFPWGTPQICQIYSSVGHIWSVTHIQCCSLTLQLSASSMAGAEYKWSPVCNCRELYRGIKTVELLCTPLYSSRVISTKALQALGGDCRPST